MNIRVVAQFVAQLTHLSAPLHVAKGVGTFRIRKLFYSFLFVHWSVVFLNFLFILFYSFWWRHPSVLEKFKWVSCMRTQFFPHCVCSYLLASLPPGVMLCLHHSTTMNLEIAPPISKNIPKRCTERKWTNRKHCNIYQLTCEKTGYIHFWHKMTSSKKLSCPTKILFSDFLGKCGFFQKNC